MVFGAIFRLLCGLGYFKIGTIFLVLFCIRENVLHDTIDKLAGDRLFLFFFLFLDDSPSSLGKSIEKNSKKFDALCSLNILNHC